MISLVCVAALAQFASAYIFVSTPMTYANADRYCATNYNSRLASFTTQAERDELYAGLQATGGRALWVGIDDLANEGTWLNIDGTPFDTAVMNKFWCIGEPNNVGTGEDCAHLGWCTTQGNTRTLNDIPCSLSYPFACNDPCKQFGIDNKAHVCGCQATACDGPAMCNNVALVADRLQVSPATATCPNAKEPNCCCSCPNCGTFTTY